jgi:hypothetical protein
VAEEAEVTVAEMTLVVLVEVALVVFELLMSQLQQALFLSL